MFPILDKYAYWKVLANFSRHPKTLVYVNELARVLAISKGLCSNIPRDLSQEGIFNCRRLGISHCYLHEENYLTYQLKRFVPIMQLHQAKLVSFIIDDNPETTSLAMYGSFATGRFSQYSDFDILHIGPKKYHGVLSTFEDALGAEINIISYRLGSWLDLKQKNEPFYQKIMKEHILLFGAEIP